MVVRYFHIAAIPAHASEAVPYRAFSKLLDISSLREFGINTLFMDGALTGSKIAVVPLPTGVFSGKSGILRALQRFLESKLLFPV